MSFELLLHLRDSLQELFQGSTYRDPAESDPEEEEAWIKPRFFIGALPPKRKGGQTNEDFPFILVRAIGGEDSEGQTDIDVEIICGFYTDDSEEDGTNIIMQVVNRIRQHLLQRRLFGKKYDLQLPINWTTGTDEERNQPHPYYVGQIRATFRTFQAPQMFDVEGELETYGSGYE